MQTSKNIKHEMLENWASKKTSVQIVKEHARSFEPGRRAISDEHAVRPSLMARIQSWRAAGGASRDRTGDLLLAKQALSQLSYGP